jgi:hypothetical protein
MIATEKLTDHILNISFRKRKATVNGIYVMNKKLFQISD